MAKSADNLTAGAGLAAGVAKWSPDTGETMLKGWARSLAARWATSPDLPWEVR